MQKVVKRKTASCSSALSLNYCANIVYTVCKLRSSFVSLHSRDTVNSCCRRFINLLCETLGESFVVEVTTQQKHPTRKLAECSIQQFQHKSHVLSELSSIHKYPNHKQKKGSSTGQQRLLLGM